MTRRCNATLENLAAVRVRANLLFGREVKKRIIDIIFALLNEFNLDEEVPFPSIVVTPWVLAKNSP